MDLKKKQRVYSIAAGILFLLPALVDLLECSVFEDWYWRGIVVDVLVLIVSVAFFLCNKLLRVISVGIYLLFRLYLVINAVVMLVKAEALVNYFIGVISSFLLLIPLFILFFMLIADMKPSLKSRRNIINKLWIMPAILFFVLSIVYEVWKALSGDGTTIFDDVFWEFWYDIESFTIFSVLLLVPLITTACYIFIGLLCNSENVFNKSVNLQIERQASAERIAAESKKYSIIGTAEQLVNYKKLLDMEMISQEEFDKKKKEILGLSDAEPQIAPTPPSANIKDSILDKGE